MVKGMNKMDVRFEWLHALKAMYVHASGDNPERSAMKKILDWADSKGLTQQPGLSLFGRNTYPTDHPEPHGYEYYLTVDGDFASADDVETKTLPVGLYAVLRFKNLFMIHDAWMHLIQWVQDNGHEQVGMYKGEHGWVNSGFEELLNWQEISNKKPPTEWSFNLWLQIKINAPLQIQQKSYTRP